MSSYTFEPGAVRTGTGAIDVVAEVLEQVHLRIHGGSPQVLQFPLRPQERLVGLGERFVRLEQSGHRVEGSIADLFMVDPDGSYFFVPLMLSSTGYAVLVETLAITTWDLGATDPEAWTVSIPEETVDVRLFRGPPKQILELATEHIGRAPAPPAWVLGVWKTTLGGTDEVLRQAERLHQERVPVTACWVYDHYDEPTNAGCGLSGTYPQGIDRYPDLPALTAGLHDHGYRVLGYHQPCIYHGSGPYEQASARGYLVRRPDGDPYVMPYFNPKTHPNEHGMHETGGAYVDLTNEDAADWFRGLLTETLDQGFDGWMQDMGEHLLPDSVMADGTTGAETRNRYSLLYHRTAHEAWSGREGASIFARSGALGAAPYLPAVWPGDQFCEWSSDRGLPSVLPAGPSAGLAGVGAFGPDIPGLHPGVDPNAAGSLDEELYIRWCQYGALNPIMRDHGGFKYRAGTPVDLWTSEATIRTFRDYADLHMRLYPYLAGLVEETARTGVPAVRALLLEYPDQDEAWWIGDQYLLGDALLVAPVHQKRTLGRRMWFPPGQWVDWWEGRRYEGPRWTEVPAPLERIPLFQRSGSRIPMLRTSRNDLDGISDADLEYRTC